MSAASTATTRSDAGDILRLCAAAGLLTGLVEGAAFLGLQHLQLLAWNMAMVAVSAEILWISPIAGLILFSAAGIAVVAAARVVPRLPALLIAFFVCGWLLFFDWLAIPGYLTHLSVAMLAAGLAAASTRWFARHRTGTMAVVRRALPWLAGAAVVMMAGVQGGLWALERLAISRLGAAPPVAPTVLVVVIDTLRADHVGAYGYGRETTPTLDRLAREGIVFESAFSTSSWTLPSHASLLTGRYSYEHGAAIKPLDGRLPTIGERLQAAGYVTAAFSANRIYFNRTQGLDRGFLHFEDYFHNAADMAFRTLYGRKFEWFVMRRWLKIDDFPARKRATDVTDAVAAWAARQSNRPLFVFTNYFDPHDPYLPPSPYRQKFSTSANPGGIINSFEFRLKPRLTAQQLQSEIDGYDGAIAYADAEVGRLIETLQARDKNLLVVVTSDHGESFGEHGLFTHKNSLYSEVIRVPLIVWWPGHVPAGVRIARPVTNAAVPATLLDLIGVNGADRADVSSLTPLWRSASSVEAWPLPLTEIAHMPFATLRDFGIPAFFGAMKSVISPDEHLIIHEKRDAELYRWREDVREEHNLIADPALRDVATQLRALLAAIRAPH